jgi:hypothetical protein
VASTGVLDQLRAKGVITGWRNEQYPVTADFYSEPAFLVERAAAVHFGIKAYGVHVNGWVIHFLKQASPLGLLTCGISDCMLAHNPHQRVVDDQVCTRT